MLSLLWLPLHFANDVNVEFTMISSQIFSLDPLTVAGAVRRWKRCYLPHLQVLCKKHSSYTPCRPIKLHVPLSISIDNEMNDAKRAIIITLNISIIYLIRYIKRACVSVRCARVTLLATNVIQSKLYYLFTKAQSKCILTTIQENNYRFWSSLASVENRSIYMEVIGHGNCVVWKSLFKNGFLQLKHTFRGLNESRHCMLLAHFWLLVSETDITFLNNWSIITTTSYQKHFGIC